MQTEGFRKVTLLLPARELASVARPGEPSAYDRRIAPAPGAPTEAAEDRPVGTLRGAAVDVSPARAARVVWAVAVLALLGTGAGFLVGGWLGNARLDRLHDHGVRVEAQVTGCLGQLGGSGSNAAGYTCRGRFRLDGAGYEEVLPGSGLRAPGDRVVLVTDPGHPHDLITPQDLARERSSATVYLLPAVLLALGLVLAATGWVLHRRRSGPPGGPAGP